MRRLIASSVVALLGVAGVLVSAGAADAAPAPTQQCSTSTVFSGKFTTCIQVAAAPQGGSTVTAGATSTVNVAKAQLTVNEPNGGQEFAGPGPLSPTAPLSYASGVGAASAGQWCATLTLTVPFFGTTLTGTQVCVTVPPLPKPPGSANQVCTSVRAPQFQTCIDKLPAAGGGSVVKATGLAVTSVPSAYLQLTGPNGFSATTTPGPLTPGTTLTYTGPAPAAAGQWCASLWITVPALPAPFSVTGNPPLCVTV